MEEITKGRSAREVLAWSRNMIDFTPIELDHERVPGPVDGLPWAESTLIGAYLPAESNEDSTLYSPPPATTEELVADLAFADVNPAAQLSATDDPAVSALAYLWLR